MEENQENVTLRIPVRIRYKVVQDYLRGEFIGEVIKKEVEGEETTEYAEVLSLSLSKSYKEGYDLLLHLQVRTLTSFFKNRIIRLNLHASLQFDQAKQEIHVEDYSLEGENNSWLINKFLQVLANTFMYSSFRKRMRFNFKNLLQQGSDDLNKKLKDHFEAYAGIFLSGKIHQLQVNEVIFGEDFLVLLISLSGNAVVDIENTDFLKA